MYVSTLAKSTGHDGWLCCRYAKTPGHRYLHRDDPPTILITIITVFFMDGATLLLAEMLNYVRIEIAARYIV